MGSATFGLSFCDSGLLHKFSCLVMPRNQISGEVLVVENYFLWKSIEFNYLLAKWDLKLKNLVRDNHYHMVIFSKDWILLVPA